MYAWVKKSGLQSIGLAIFLLGLAGTTVAAESELIIEITSGIDNQTKIAIVPFGWSGEGVLPESIDEIVSNDLYRTGQFRPLEKVRMLNRPSTRQDIAFSDWQVLGVEYLVIGRLQPDGSSRSQRDVTVPAVKYVFELYDIRLKERLMISEGSSGDLRDLAHFVSDEVYEYLTGIPGAFSTHILYVTVERQSPSKSYYRLRRADADGHRVVTLFESEEPVLSPTWSPDGLQVAYVSYHKGERPAIFVQDIATGKQTQVTAFKGLNGAPDWSPDGRSLLVTLSKDGNPEIYQLMLATGQLKRLTRHYGIDTEPRWMPDGQHIIFTSNRGGSPQIYKMALATQELERLTYEGSYNARPSVSADGRFLAFVHRRAGKFHVAVQDLEHGYLRVLTETKLDESPSIAPNGSMLIYATQENAKEMLSAVSLDGKVKVKLPARTGAVREPAWSPHLVRQ